MLKRGRKTKLVPNQPKVTTLTYPDVPPKAVHFGYRADRFPRSSGDIRWWQSQGWNGQFDLISHGELSKRIAMAKSLGIESFDYDEMCWD